jgi:hypothetical protein
MRPKIIAKPRNASSVGRSDRFRPFQGCDRNALTDVKGVMNSDHLDVLVRRRNRARTTLPPIIQIPGGDGVKNELYSLPFDEVPPQLRQESTFHVAACYYGRNNRDGHGGRRLPPSRSPAQPAPIGRLRSGEIASFTATVRYVRYTSLGRPATNRMQKAGQRQRCAVAPPPFHYSLRRTPVSVSLI